MNTNKLLKNVLISLLIAGLYTWMLFIFFDIFTVYPLTRVIVLICGASALILRLARFIKDPSSFLYVFISVTNIILGFVAICLLIFHHSDKSWVHYSLLNLLVGVAIIGDGILFPKTKHEYSDYSQ